MPAMRVWGKGKTLRTKKSQTQVLPSQSVLRMGSISISFFQFSISVLSPHVQLLSIFLYLMALQITNYQQLQLKVYKQVIIQIAQKAMKITKNTKDTSTPVNLATKYAKKAELIRQKILTNATITHNSYQYQIEKLNEQLEQQQLNLRQMFKQMDAKTKQIVNQYKQTMQPVYVQSNNKSEQQHIISAEQLKRYLNTQKNILKQKLQSQEKSKQSSGKEGKNLHTLMKSAHLQELLQQIQIAQLQKQIKYLSTHVINSSGLIYVPENVMSETQELQLNQKVQIQLQQLKRLTSLEVICGNQKGRQRNRQKTPQQAMLIILDEQDRRLNKASEILTTQKQLIQSLEGSIQKYENILQSIPLYSTRKSDKKSTSLMLKVIPPTPLQLQTIINSLPQQLLRTQIVSNQTCQYEQIANNLKSLRNKLKKIQ